LKYESKLFINCSICSSSFNVIYFSHIFTFTATIMHQPLTGTALYFHLESVFHPFYMRISTLWGTFLSHQQWKKIRAALLRDSEQEPTKNTMKTIVPLYDTCNFSFYKKYIVLCFSIIQWYMRITPDENFHAFLPDPVWIMFNFSRTDFNLKFKAKATNSCHQIQSRKRLCSQTNSDS